MKTKYMYSAEKWNGGWIGILLYDKNYKSHGNVEILHSEKELADFLKKLSEDWCYVLWWRI